MSKTNSLINPIFEPDSLYINIDKPKGKYLITLGNV